MSFPPRFPHFLHGGDYNPDQWLDRPDILERDVQLKVALLDALPYGVIATQRGNTVFLQYFSGESRKVALSCKYKDLLTGTYCTGAVEMPVNSVMVLTK